MNFHHIFLVFNKYSRGNNGKMEPWHMVVFFGGIVLLSILFIRKINRNARKKEQNKKPPKQYHKYISSKGRRR